MQVSATTFQGYFITYFNFQDIVLLKRNHTLFFSVSFLSIIHVIVQICCIKESYPFGKHRSIHLYIHPTLTLEHVQLTPPTNPKRQTTGKKPPHDFLLIRDFLFNAKNLSLEVWFRAIAASLLLSLALRCQETMPFSYILVSFRRVSRVNTLIHGESPMNFDLNNKRNKDYYE